MWIWIGAIFLAVIILLIILVLLSNIHIEASIETRNTQAEMEFRVKMIYGIVRFHYELPVERFEELKIQMAKLVEEKINEKKLNRQVDAPQDTDSSNKQGQKGFNYEVKELMKSAYALRIWDTYDFSMLRITKLTWQTRIGTEDVVFTSMLTGLLWGIKNTMLGWLSYKVKFTDGPDLKVNALWDERWSLETILEFRAYIRFFRVMKIFHTISRRLVHAHGGIWAWRRDLSK